MQFFIDNLPSILAISGIALSVILTGIGSARGGAMISKAAAALISEQPEKFGKSLILFMMHASQGLYGFIIGFLIFTNLGPDLTIWESLRFFGSGAIMGFAGLHSCIGQSTAATAGIQILAKKPEHSTKGVLYSAMIETYAIFAFVVAMLIIFM